MSFVDDAFTVGTDKNIAFEAAFNDDETFGHHYLVGGGGYHSVITIGTDIENVVGRDKQMAIGRFEEFSLCVGIGCRCRCLLLV